MRRNVAAAEATAIVLGFACLAVATTYPLVVMPGNHLPSDLGDPLLTAWTLAWDADRLRHGLAGIWDAPNYFPYRHTLVYSDHLLGIAIFTAPLQWVAHNPVLVYNVAFFASFMLSGGGMYVLAREVTGRRDAAFVAGTIFACQPFRVSHYAHLQWLITGWLPLSLWAMHKFFATRRSRWLYAATLFFLVQSLTAAYFTYFAMLPLAVVTAFEWRRARPQFLEIIKQAWPALTMAFLMLLPIVVAYYQVRRDIGLHRSADEIVDLSADIADYFRAPPQLRLWGRLGNGRGEHELFPGAVTLALALFGAATRPRDRLVVLYAIVAASAFLLSLGPMPSAWGHRLGIPGPYATFLRIVPGLDGLRAPARLAVVVQVALAVLAAFAASWLFDRVTTRLRGFIVSSLIAAVVAEGWAAPIPVAEFDPRGDSRDREAYAYLRSLPAGAVIELPTSVNQAEPEFRYQFMTLVHRHPAVNGHSGYVPPLLQWLGGGHSPLREDDRQRDAVEMLRGIGIRYIVVHRRLFADQSLAAALRGEIERDRSQIVACQQYGDTTVATLAPLDLPAFPSRTNAIPVIELRARSSSETARLPALFDDDPDTRWLSGGPQTGGEWIDLDLGHPRDVGVVRLRTAPRSFGDYPRTLVIEAVDNGAPRTLFSGTVLPQFARGLLADPDHPWTDVVLPSNRTRMIRLRQVGMTRTFFWSIHELRLYERL